jgi:uncharacterized protein involved in type VI secretion and phage assembly
MVDVHHKVKFSFSSQGDPGTHWRVVRLHGREALSEPFDVVLDLANEDLAADPGALLGKGALLELTRDAHVRNVVGVARRVEHHGTTAGHLLCRVHLAPALLALAQRVNSRIFQEMKVPDIVKKVLDEGLSPFSRAVRLDLTREYPVREYCVQHRESDLDFVQRLLAEEGIGYTFDFGDTSAETLVLFDAFEPLADVLTLDAGPVPIVGDGGGTMATETVRHFEQTRQLQSTSVVARDFDWTQPTLDLTRESRGADANGMDREVFEYPAGLTIGEYSNPRYTAEDGAAQARLRREGHAQNDRTYRGVGGVQTATVTGPAGEEIYTDEHGRIKVQFHWDREGARDEKSSCWVRVMQPWAGRAGASCSSRASGWRWWCSSSRATPTDRWSPAASTTARTRPPTRSPTRRPRAPSRATAPPAAAGTTRSASKTSRAARRSTSTRRRTSTRWWSTTTPPG